MSLTDPNPHPHCDVRAAWIETNYDYPVLTPNFWVCDALGSLHTKPFLTLAEAEGYLGARQ